MWHEFTIALPGELKEPVTAVLFGMGCLGMSEEAGRFRAYFQGDAQPGDVMDALSGFEGVTVGHREVQEQDWYGSWKEGFGPVRAHGLLICPPWKVERPGPDEVLLMLDPGQAFGAGDHVTTLTVLEMLRAWVRGQEGLSGKRFLDLGTGTGILAIAGYLYGIRDITAVDTEPAAVETAGRNLSLNGLVGKVRLMPGGIKEAGRGYDLIAANLFLEVIQEIIPDAAPALNPGGSLVVSGLLEGQEAGVIKTAGEAGLSLVERMDREGWVSALFRA